MKDILRLISQLHHFMNPEEISQFTFKVLDNMPFPVMIKNVDDNYRYIFWNKQSDLESEYDRNETLGKTDSEIYGEELGKRIREQDEMVVKNGTPFRVEETMIARNQQIRYTIREKSVFKIKDIHLLIVVWWDITEQVNSRKELEQLNEEKTHLIERNQLILENANIGLVFLTPDYSVQWTNLPSYMQHPQVRSFIESSADKCYQKMGHNSICPDCIVAKAFQSGRIEKKITQSPSQDLVIEITVNIVHSAKNKDKIEGVVLKLEDITEKYRKNEELKKAKENAEQANILKSAFLANMSHEIRTPLNAIVGFSQVIADTENKEERQEFAHIITQNNELLLQLIDDILDISKIESGTMTFTSTSVNINLLMSNLEDLLKLKAKNNPQLEIAFTDRLPECTIKTDEKRLQQVLINLLTNALKYTEQGHIHFGYTFAEEGKKLLFYVSDTGTGIPEEKQEAVFERFTKLNEFKNGTGLGLAISRTIVQKLGGYIKLKTNEYGGCLFYFTVSTRFVPEN